MEDLHLLKRVNYKYGNGTISSVPMYLNLSGYNPDVLVEEHMHRGSVYKVIQDTVLPSGTKQRGIKFFADCVNQGVETIVSYGTVYGYGQVALAYCCSQLKLKCTIYVPKIHPRTSMTQRAINLGATVMEIGDGNRFVKNGELHKLAEVESSSLSNSLFIPLGLANKEYMDALTKAIKICCSKIKPKRIWVAGGSGVIASSLYKALGCKICIVQVGRPIWEDMLEGMDYIMYKSEQPFNEDTKVLPPYKSLSHYDAKVWQFAIRNWEEGDYIWNVK